MFNGDDVRRFKFQGTAEFAFRPFRPGYRAIIAVAGGIGRDIAFSFVKKPDADCVVQQIRGERAASDAEASNEQTKYPLHDFRPP